MAGSVFKSSSYPLMFFLSCLSLSCVYSSNGVFFSTEEFFFAVQIS